MIKSQYGLTEANIARSMSPEALGAMHMAGVSIGQNKKILEFLEDQNATNNKAREASVKADIRSKVKFENQGGVPGSVNHFFVQADKILVGLTFEPYFEKQLIEELLKKVPPELREGDARETRKARHWTKYCKFKKEFTDYCNTLARVDFRKAKTPSNIYFEW